MKVENYPEKIKELEEKLGEEFDEETRDEIEYDDESAKKMMDYILENTKDMIIFKTLYEKAASKMLSIDIDIGMTILFSYDYLPLFHKCLCKHFTDNSLTENSVEYKNLMKSII
tara:strand:+ start:432 stop:773 length:342 start_codon:yes stop_codon:yes gene_type:complete